MSKMVTITGFISILLLSSFVARVEGISKTQEASRLNCTRVATESGSADENWGCLVKGETSLRFFLLGDTGGWPIWPYYTPAQKRLAKQLEEMARLRRSQFQFSLGDNFYLGGVDNVESKRFNRTFEDVFAGKSLDSPWYVVAGNHDHYGNVSAQVLYTNRSSRWTMPSLYYSVGYRLANGVTMEAVMIDTVTLAGNSLTKNASLVDLLSRTADIIPTGPEDEEAAETQWQWIEQRLSHSKADYLFVMGHYPVYSVAEHGPTRLLVERLKPLLEQHHVTAYVSGHDHTLEYIRPNGSSVAYVVSGAASRADHCDVHLKSIPNGSLKLLYPSAKSSGLIPTAMSQVPYFTALVQGILLNKNPPQVCNGFQMGFHESGFVYAQIEARGGKFEFYDENAHLLEQFQFQPRHNGH